MPVRYKVVPFHKKTPDGQDHTHYEIHATSSVGASRMDRPYRTEAEANEACDKLNAQ